MRSFDSLFAKSEHFSNCSNTMFQISKLSTMLQLPSGNSKFSSTSISNNIRDSPNCKMESDYEDNASTLNTSSAQVDISQLFQQLSSQIIFRTTLLQEQIQDSNQKVLSNFQKLAQDHEDFKRNMKVVLDSLHQGLMGGSISNMSLPLGVLILSLLLLRILLVHSQLLVWYKMVLFQILLVQYPINTLKC